MPRISFHRSLFAVAAIAVLPWTASTPAYAAAPPDRAILALGKLGPADLDVNAGAGKALIASLFPGEASPCPMPTGPNPDFDRACMWSQTGNEEDFDILIGIEGHAIVSVVTSSPRQLDARTWACGPFSPDTPDDGLAICSVRSAPRPTREHWAASWRAYLSSIN